MAEEYYKIPKDPQYRAAAIRKLQDSDPASATLVFNPLIEAMLESLAHVQAHKAALGEDGKVDASQLPALGGHIAQAEEPENKNLLWIDTANDNIIKFYDPESETWKPVGAVWWR